MQITHFNHPLKLPYHFSRGADEPLTETSDSQEIPVDVFAGQAGENLFVEDPDSLAAFVGKDEVATSDPDA